MKPETIIDRNQTLDFSTLIKLVALGTWAAAICKQLVSLKNRCKKPFEQIKVQLKLRLFLVHEAKTNCMTVLAITRTQRKNFPKAVDPLVAGTTRQTRFTARCSKSIPEL